METDEKECPYCAETIKAKTKVCKHCGRSLTGDYVQPPPPNVQSAPPPKKGNIITSCLGCLGLIIFAAIIAGAFTSVGEKKAGKITRGVPAPPAVAHAPAQDETPAESARAAIPAETILADYKANEIGGDNKYKGKNLVIVGKVKSVTAGASSGATMRLTTPAGELSFAIAKADI